MNNGHIGTKRRIAKLLSSHFASQPHKAALWLMVRNPLLGNVMPLVLIAIGREKKLLQFIETQLEENER